MNRSYTVELRSTPIDGLNDEILDQFATKIFREPRLAGPVASADLALHVIELRTSVDAPSIAKAVEIAEVCFFRSLDEANTAEVAAWEDVEGIDMPDELVFGGEVARRLDLSRERIRQLAAGNSFPRPLGMTGRDRIYRWGDVAKWARLNQRKTKTPRRRVTQTELESLSTRKAAKKMSAR